MSDIKEPNYSAGNVGKYTCTRCGWKWTPRAGCPDPPRACARCRTAYWQTAPTSSRANSPDDPKWQEERELVARRRRERHFAKLRELAAEFGLQLPPIGDTSPPTKGLRQPAVPPLDSRVRLNEPAPSRGLTSAPATPPPPARPLAEALARALAQSKQKAGPA